MAPMSTLTTPISTLTTPLSTPTTSIYERETTLNVGPHHHRSNDRLSTTARPHIVASTAAATISSITRSNVERDAALEQAQGRESGDCLSTIEGFDTGSSSERDTVSVVAKANTDMRPSVGNLATSNPLKQSASQSSSLEHSPSTKTLEKLRSFKFVKIASSKPGNTHPVKRPTTPDSQSDLTPPPNKRRPVCIDVTNCEPMNDTSNHDNASIDQDRSTFKKPSFIPRTHLNSSMVSFPSSSPSSSDEIESSKVNSQVNINLFSSPSSSHQGQRSNVAISAQVKSTINMRGTFSNEVASSSAMHSGSQPNRPLPWTRTSTAPQQTCGACRTHLSRAVTDAQPRFRTPNVVSQSLSGIAPSSPLSTVTSSQLQTRLSTPQMSEHELMMQTPTRGRQTTPLVCTPAGGVATPISRTSVPIKRKFPGPAGLLPSLVCVNLYSTQGSPHSWWAWFGRSLLPNQLISVPHQS